MIRDFDTWAAPLVETSSFSDLRNCVVAIEASHYLQRYLVGPPIKEPLVVALGGFPYSLKTTISNELETFRDHGITPFFVFSGLNAGKKDRVFQASEEATRVNAEAWELYNQHQAQRAVEAFGSSSSITPEHWYRFFQSILRDANIGFQVAPYTAWAQLAYLEKHAPECIDAIAGSSEILLFDSEKVITKFDFEHKEFTWIRRRNCLMALDNIPPEMFVDACMLSGTSFFPTFPTLDGSHHRKQSKIRGAMDLMMGLGRSGISVCLHYQDDPQLRSTSYLDKYRRNRLAIKHHIILTKNGKVEPLNAELAPGDIHEFIGQRLPDELYFYLSKGLIGPKVLNWRTSGEIIEQPSLDGGEWEDYRVLIRDLLTPLRVSTISLLSLSLNHYYQHKDVSLRCYFDRASRKPISTRDAADEKPIIGGWVVKWDIIQSSQAFSKAHFGLLGFAVSSLADSEFASKTITRRDASKPLTKKEELIYNSIWRFLHLREYIDSNHCLTAWGKVLHASIGALDGRRELEEPVFLAVELMRLDYLNGKINFPSYYGPSLRRGSEASTRNSILISRVACLGKLQHKPIGYTGPLNRFLLAFNAVISAVRDNLRNLLEMSAATLLLNGDAERDRKDLTDIGIDLPFLLDNDCTLGIAVKSYLDEVLVSENPASPEVKQLARTKGVREWLPYSIDFSADIDTAFLLWDATYAGVKVAGNLVRDRAMWDDANEWLADKR